MFKQSQHRLSPMYFAYGYFCVWTSQKEKYSACKSNYSSLTAKLTGGNIAFTSIY